MKFQITLEFIDKDDKEKTIYYSVLIDAENQNEAISMARALKDKERPDLLKKYERCWQSEPVPYKES